MEHFRVEEPENNHSTSELSPASANSIDAIKKIKDARTSYDIFKILKFYGASFRLNRFIVFLASDDKVPALDDRVVLTNWDNEVIQRALADDFFHWSFTSGLRARVLPKSVILDDPAASPTDKGELAQFLLSRGYRAFVHLPVRSSNGKAGAVSFNGMRELVGVDEVIHLGFVAEHAFERLMQIAGDAEAQENPLSPREIECLKAVARGLSVAETGHRVGITPHTVNYHLANAQKKLAARNKLHAVVLALQRGWLGRH